MTHATFEDRLTGQESWLLPLDLVTFLENQADRVVDEKCGESFQGDGSPHYIFIYSLIILTL